MKKIKLLMILFLSMTGIIMLHAGTADSIKTKISGYGFNCSSVTTSVHGIYSFCLDSTMHDVTSLGQVYDVSRVSGAVLIGEKFYFLDWTHDPYVLRYCTLNDTTRREVKVYDEYISPAYMSLNKSDGKVYCIGTDYDNTTYEDLTYLQTINLTTGDITNVCTLKDKDTNACFTIEGFAINKDGEMYALNDSGDLYSINATDGKCTKIGTMDYLPDESIYFSNNCLFFDNNTDKMYYRMETSSAHNELVQIDTKTAKVTRINKLQDNIDLDGISVIFQEAVNAPAKVENLKVLPGEKGALKAILSWDNPTKTNRDSTLNEITSVVILRNNVKVAEITDAKVGGHSTWEDNTITANGEYKYAVKAINKNGEGESAIKNVFIGRGIPMPVTNVKLLPKNDGCILSWKAPEIGQDSSYIDVNELKYDIVRYPDKKAVATDVTDTTFAEESIDSLQSYYYAVIAKTKEGNSSETSSNEAVLGKALNAPCNFPFDVKTSLNTWTIIDANDDNNTWHWLNGYGSKLTGASINNYYDKKSADEWLVSPRINLESKNKYRISFVMESTGEQTDTLNVTLGTSALPSNQTSFDKILVESNKKDTIDVDLPVISADGVYCLGFHFQSAASTFGFRINSVKIEVNPATPDGIYMQQTSGKILINGKKLMVGDNDNVSLFNAGGMFMNIRKLGNGAYDLSSLKHGVYIVLVSNGTTERKMKVTIK